MQTKKQPREMFRQAAREAAVCACGLVLMFSSVALAAEPKSDEDAIRGAIDSYVAAYNRGDAKAVAALWSESGHWTSPDGDRIQGRQAIEKALAKLFADNQGLQIAVPKPSVRLVAPDAAVEEGTVRMTRPNQSPEDSSYVAVHVKENGKWKLNSVYETSLPEEPAASSPLEELAWLVGSWGDESPDADAAATISWTKNKKFLNYSFKMTAPGEDPLEGTQVVGWDPAAETIRSWMFDSDGGIGQGVWSKKDGTWVVKFEQVLPDGRKASATNIYGRVDDDTIVWSSIGRKIDGEFLPNVDNIKLVRKTVGEPSQ
jgi:uncharacterized protein (TIGR02246 family)